jgi:DMSO/TMAO reductase YedYZ molybdopterin-dependent catalytic subunit
MIRKVYIFTVVISALFFTVGVAPPVSAQDNETGEKPEDKFGYLSEYRGLHITGKAIEIDTSTYRLNIKGKVEEEKSFTFSEIKRMKSKRMKIALSCPGFFTDIGYWTGVPVRTLLDKAGIKESARQLTFTTVTGGYSSELPIERIEDEGILIAYHFNDEEFHKVHGFPLRLVAKDEPGNVWVKWLGNIIVE